MDVQSSDITVVFCVCRLCALGLRSTSIGDKLTVKLALCLWLDIFYEQKGEQNRSHLLPLS